MTTLAFTHIDVAGLEASGRYPFVPPARALLDALVAKAGAALVVAGDGSLYCLVAERIAPLATFEECLILHEIYVAGCYNFRPARPCVVADIGMNVGHAALFLAGLPGVEAVAGFEPFPATFAQAQANLALNPRFADRIMPFNFGLAAANRQVTAPFCAELKGCSSVYGTATHLQNRTDLVEVPISLVDAAPVFAELAAEFPGRDLVVKMDCEGAELEILERLAGAGTLPLIRAFLLEYHQGHPARLTTLLTQAGFTVVWLTPGSAVGMLYAVR